MVARRLVMDNQLMRAKANIRRASLAAFSRGAKRKRCTRIRKKTSNYFAFLERHFRS